jgi:uncharacterized membrane protein YciS (DUF1049 family)
VEILELFKLLQDQSLAEQIAANREALKQLASLTVIGFSAAWIFTGIVFIYVQIKLNKLSKTYNPAKEKS